jgi:hypothetical protein
MNRLNTAKPTLAASAMGIAALAATIALPQPPRSGPWPAGADNGRRRRLGPGAPGPDGMAS